MKGFRVNFLPFFLKRVVKVVKIYMLPNPLGVGFGVFD